jgi:mono/diheme cytochrome c family protein
MRPSLLALCILALASSAAAAEDRQIARGHALVQRQCAGCHAVNRTGASPNPAAPAFRDLNRNYRIDDLGEALAEGILTGHPAMPAVRFPPEDIAAITAYLQSIQTRQEAMAPANLAHDGERPLSSR